MARKRLHGATQKRRKKVVTRDLKRAETVVRPSVTQAGAPFESSPQLDREDLEFLETMKDLGVHRSRWTAEAPRRTEAIQRVYFEEESAQQATFSAHMSQLGVRPVDAPAAPASAHGPSAAHPPAAPASAVRFAPATPDTPRQAPTPANTPTPEPARQAPTAPGLVFTEDGGAADMAALLEAHPFAPGDKFHGAPPPARPSPAGPSPHHNDDIHPDDELDLHGKTLEEAIHMVQNFVLRAHQSGMRHILLITGKGLNSGPGGPVLRDAVQHWLERNGGHMVSGWHFAPPRLGGEGAIWVNLRAPTGR